jgi:hypothetical protein
MPFIALKPLKVGEDTVLPGEEIPVEEGRDYDVMIRVGDAVWAEQAPAPKAEKTTARRPKAPAPKADGE